MRLERSDIKYPLWRKKVDSSLFTKLDTPIPNWLADVWSIKEQFGENTSKKEPKAQVQILFEKQTFVAWVAYAKYQSKDTKYKLFFSKAFIEKLKDVFIMSFMRSLEGRLRKTSKVHYKNTVEEDIPFWEFLDIEFDSTNKIFICKAHYFQKPIFPELFRQFVKSHLLKEIENDLLHKGIFKFVKEDWKARSTFKMQLERRNIIYYLIDTHNRLLYIGESENTKRIIQVRNEIPNWDFFRVDCLPEWLTREQRLELERLVIRSFATVLNNSQNISTIPISNYTLVNKKIDR